MSKRKKDRVGENEFQDSLFAPQSDWCPPEVLPDFSKAKILAVDTETKDPKLLSHGPGNKRGDGHVAGISIASDLGTCVYLPIGHLGGGNLDRDYVRRYVSKTLASDKQLKLFANAPYDLGWLATLDIEVKGPIRDVILNEALLDEDRDGGYSLEAISTSRVGRGKNEDLLRRAAEIHGINAKSDLWRLPSKYVGLYAQDDARLLIPIFAQQLQELNDQGLNGIFELESGLIPIIHKMRERGVPVDLDAAARLSATLLERENRILGRLKDETGYSVDPWSGDSIATVCDALGISYGRTEKGNPSFAKDFLKNQEHALFKGIEEYRTINRTRSKFIEGDIIECSIDGRIYTNFHQTHRDEGGTRTGRFAMSNPNLQQVPKRSEFGKLVRALFVADEGAQWGKFDYAQQEPRITVHYAYVMGFDKADSYKQAYDDDPTMDFYGPIIRDTGAVRRDAKDLALGRNYGMGIKEMAKRLGVTEEVAEEKLRRFDDAAPFIKRLSESCALKAQRTGCIRTILGRKRRFDKWEPVNAYQRRKLSGNEGRIIPCSKELAERKWPGTRLVRAFVKDAFNSLIQGSAADQTKKAMLTIYEEMDYVPYITVHDELDGPIHEEKEVKQIKEIMETCVPMEVPSIADVDLGDHWL